MKIQTRQQVIDCGDRPLLMGILNVTPDSFYDGGAYLDPHAAVDHAIRLVEEGADILDIGAESTRPGSIPIGSEEECRRLIPVVSEVAKSVSVPISVDTSRGVVAREALAAGAVIVNDVTALRGDSTMVALVIETGAGLILMHMQGTPKTMQQAPSYQDVVNEIAGFLAERAEYAEKCGVKKSQIILDPGIGFGKVLVHNLDLIARLGVFANLGFPLLVGVSRKGFIGQLTGQPVEARLMGTAAAVALAVEHGANIIRVHDVAAMRDVIKLAAAVKERQNIMAREQHA
ncbi:dihydropteroate synthase [Petrachloros mirabilis]